jgi:uncharacterized LabA/DUF88 family protein
MSIPPSYAVLIDGGFVIQKLSERSRPKTFPTADEIETVSDTISAHPCVSGQTRLRVYFYHARPAVGVMSNPIDGTRINLSATEVFKRSESLLDSLELRADYALRLGETSIHEWKLGDRALKSLLHEPRPIRANDLVPNIEQKGVDLRIGLDIARLALNRSVQSIITVTGDSDLIPAFRFARREGLRVFLCHLRHGIKRELRAHADRVIDINLPPVRQVRCSTTYTRSSVINDIAKA